MSVRDYIQNNFGWKLASLLLAALTWFTIKTEVHKDKALQHSPVRTTSIRIFDGLPVTVQTFAFQARGFELDPAVASVKITGPEELLENLRPEQVEVYVDLKEFGDQDRARKELLVRVPEGVQVTGVVPAQIDVHRAGKGPSSPVIQPAP